MTCFVQAVQVICAMIWVLQSKLRIAVFAILNVVNASDCVFVCVCVIVVATFDALYLTFLCEHRSATLRGLETNIDRQCARVCQ